MKDTKINLFLDADDTILKSSETIINLLNKKYNIVPPKTIKDLKDWGYRSIWKNLPSMEVEQLFASDEFFEDIKPFQGFLDFYSHHGDKFNITVVTAGTPDILAKKKQYFDIMFQNAFKFRGIEFPRNDLGKFEWNYDKSIVDMQFGIQIDDRVDALRSTNANLKILFKGNGDYYWNQPESYANISNLYVTNGWEEVSQILLFAHGNHGILKKGGL